MQGIERTGGVAPGDIIEIKRGDFHRVGGCWMRDRLLEGDLAIAVKQNGDCFWTYALLEHESVDVQGRPLYRLIPEARFGAYVLGTPYRFTPTDREKHLLLAGERIFLSAEVEAKSQASGPALMTAGTG